MLEKLGRDAILGSDKGAALVFRVELGLAGEIYSG